MTICEKCGQPTYIIHITTEHKRICDLCYEEKKKEKKYEQFRKEVLQRGDSC